MPRPTKNILGNKFGQLTVIARDKNRNGKAVWICKCDCGKQVSIYATNLFRGLSTTCGNRYNHTVIPPNTLGWGVSAFNVYFKLLKESAQKRGIPFELTKEQVILINSKNCFYCNCPPSQKVLREKKLAGVYIYNGIDRVDNTKGYTINNVVPCCKYCNSAKMSLSLNDFKSLIRRIYFHWASL